jgi:ribonuclease P protein component
MLQKKKRVIKKVFQTIIEEGKTFSTPLFLFYVLKSEQPQYAFVSPKKIFKTAAKRNKYRRIGYNILRSLPVKNNKGIFFYKKQAETATKEEIKENIIFILKKAGTI